MIYMSAQPDEYYFLWQVQIQLFNFRRIGIPGNTVHVIIGFDPEKGLNPHFESFIYRNTYGIIFTYPDTRPSKNYPSSIRPHIIYKHFQQYPYLSEAIIFYHDSDIIFKKQLSLNDLLEDSTWYASNTLSYTGVDFIIDQIGKVGFEKMCTIVNIDADIVRNSKNNAGGAQYIIKDVPASFWEKLEVDSENLFSYLEAEIGQSNLDSASNSHVLQPWCADMWAFWWNALLIKKCFKVSEILDFCWANSDINMWKDTSILHYTGSIAIDNNHHFKKSNYSYYPPYYVNFKHVDRKSCSQKLINEIKLVRQERDVDRKKLSDTTFLIPIRIDSSDRLENLEIIINYLQKSFDTNIIVLEADKNQRVINLPEGVQYYYICDGKEWFHRTKYLNILIKKARTPFISIYDADVIFPEKQIIQCVDWLRKGDCNVAYPYTGFFGEVDVLAKHIFSKILDSNYLTENIGKLRAGSMRSCGGAVFVDRQKYISAGMENEQFKKWGAEDKERLKRMEILDFRIKRSPGALYHLPHKRGKNSRYLSMDDQTTSIKEFIKVANMTQKELIEYISLWK